MVFVHPETIRSRKLKKQKDLIISLFLGVAVSFEIDLNKNLAAVPIENQSNLLNLLIQQINKLNICSAFAPRLKIFLKNKNLILNLFWLKSL